MRGKETSMATIEIQPTKRYRILYDPENMIWHQIPMWSTGSSIDCDDGMTVEQKIGGLKGITRNKLTTTTGYILDATVAQAKPTIVEKTLEAGETEKNFTNNDIKNSSVIQISTSDYSVQPKKAVQSGTTVTLTFNAPDHNVSVRLLIYNYQ